MVDITNLSLSNRGGSVAVHDVCGLAVDGHGRLAGSGAELSSGEGAVSRRNRTLAASEGGLDGIGGVGAAPRRFGSCCATSRMPPAERQRLIRPVPDPRRARGRQIVLWSLQPRPPPVVVL